MTGILDFLSHLDVHLAMLIAAYGPWTYVLLFTIVFCETGLVVTPFLPGDSLLFAIGAICALGSLDVAIVIPTLMVAANCGDAVNYFVGKKLGQKLVSGSKRRIINPDALARTHAFYEKYGAKTIVFARFVPIVRTFAPFVAGLGTMRFPRFAAYSVFGGAFWVISFVILGFLFGNQEVVKKNFVLVIGMIIVLSIAPAVIEVLRQRRKDARNIPFKEEA
ncbi:MAG: DedA family protein [Candidatus Kapaibacterium sp.]